MTQYLSIPLKIQFESLLQILQTETIHTDFILLKKPN